MDNLQKNFANATFGVRSALLIGALLLSGCASIVGSDKETLSVASTPPDAQILIIDEAGRTVYRGRTPDQIALPKSNGRYWGGKTFSVAISKRGYVTQRVQVDTRPNPFYLGGNYLFGGLIGWLLVDSTSSRMYDLSSEGIQVSLPRLPGDAATRLVAPPEVTGEVAAEGPAATSTSAIDLRLPTPPAEPGREIAPIAPSLPPAAPAVVTPVPPPLMEPTQPAPPDAPPGPSPTFEPASPPVPDETPVAPKTPRPYWPAPPPLPVSPSTASPSLPLLATR